MTIRISKKYMEGIKTLYSYIEPLEGIQAQAQLGVMLMSEFDSFAREIEEAAIDKEEGKRLADIIRNKYREAA